MKQEVENMLQQIKQKEHKNNLQKMKDMSNLLCQTMWEEDILY